ncbi:LamG domain-containing protein [Halorubrum laminariae]|uniref:LamG domain-containing protein n=1 Tax=Halorubrum laminariae TaxID=1433523 RepID=A0ABD6BZA6_9EURY|nr:LamG domain-containing protein [Halorubrum laminariae]
MTGEGSRFKSDRRGCDDASWSSIQDWDQGVGENVDIVDGSVVPRAPNQIAERPDSGISRFAFEQNVADSWGDNGGVDGTSVGYSVDSPVGQYAKRFDGNGEVTFGEVFQISSDASISVWLNVTSGIGDVVPMVHKGRAYQFHVHADGSLWFGTFGHGYVSNQLSWELGRWYHCLIAWDDSNSRAQFYRDGVAVGAMSGNDGPGGSGTFRVGHKADGGGYLHGMIADLRIYGEALSSVRVSDLYNTGSIR